MGAVLRLDGHVVGHLPGSAFTDACEAVFGTFGSLRPWVPPT